jgi:hypothetical protein
MRSVILNSVRERQAERRGGDAAVQRDWEKARAILAAALE